MSPFTSPLNFSASKLALPKKYVLCAEDLCKPAALQRQMAEKGGAEIVSGPFGHSPFMRGDGLDMLVGLAGELAA